MPQTEQEQLDNMPIVDDRGQVVDVRPRDEQGRFTPTQTDPEDDEPQLFERVIDHGDGSAPEVFRAATMEELIDKLASAKGNATRKIRELTQAQKQNTQEQRKAKKLTADEEMVIGAELLTNPSVAFKKLFESETGQTIEEYQADQVIVQEMKQARANFMAEQQFKTANPDYVSNASNDKRMLDYLTTYQLPITKDNLEAAYQSLLTGGLLVTEQPTAQAVPVQKKASSGLSVRSGSGTPPPARKPGELSAKEQAACERMSSSELLQFMAERGL